MSEPARKPSSTAEDSSKELARRLAAIADAKQATDLVALDVR